MTRGKTVFLTLLFLPLAGCFSPSHPAPSTPPIVWGLGLDVPKTLPMPGPFWEGTANVTALANALNFTAPYVLSKCQATSDEWGNFQRDVARQNLLSAIDEILGWCQGPAWALSEKMAADAIANGTEERDFWRVQDHANQTVTEEENYISRALAPPGTIVDAEVQDHIMANHVWYLLTFNAGRHSIDGYKRNHNKLDLQEAFLTALVPAYGAEATKHFIARFPWSQGICEAPDMAPYGSRLMAQISRLLNESLRLEPPSEGYPVDEIYGALLKGNNIAVPYLIERGWWVGLVGEAGILTLFQGIMDTHASNRLPTREEAAYLLALHQRDNRTLAGESQMSYFKSQLGSGPPLDWQERHEAEARKALALSKLHSGFQDLRCTPVAPPTSPLSNGGGPMVPA